MPRLYGYQYKSKQSQIFDNRDLKNNEKPHPSQEALSRKSSLSYPALIIRDYFVVLQPLAILSGLQSTTPQAKRQISGDLPQPGLFVSSHWPCPSLPFPVKTGGRLFGLFKALSSTSTHSCDHQLNDFVKIIILILPSQVNQEAQFIVQFAKLWYPASYPVFGKPIALNYRSWNNYSPSAFHIKNKNKKKKKTPFFWQDCVRGATWTQAQACPPRAHSQVPRKQ